MTAGTVVLLGRFGRNVAAGMSGGELLVHDPEERLQLRLNGDLAEAGPLDPAAGERVHALLERHVRYTDSPRAAALLARWPTAVTEFRRVAPRATVAKSLDAQPSVAAS
jgi:glutamate synthase domain-containing protein 3